MTFSEYAVAVLGMPAQGPEGIAKLRVWPAESSGPPNGPSALRVSTIRHGVTAKNCTGEANGFTNSEYVPMLPVYSPLLGVKVATIASVPTAKVLVTQLAICPESVTSVQPVIAAALEVKLTVPAGAGGPAGATVAVKAMDVPDVVGFMLEVTVVVVPANTVSVSAA